jgi:plastocyanin
MLVNNTPTAHSGKFNTTTNTWTDLPPLPVAVGQASEGATGTKLYVAGGFLGGPTPGQITSTLQIYDTVANTWSFGPSMPASKEAGGGVILNNKLYAIGGDDLTNPVATNYIFDIATSTWSTGAPLPAPRSNTYATAYNGMIYVFGGAVGGTFTADDHLLRYDPTANTWTDLGSAGTGGRGNYGAVSPLGTGRLLITDGGTTAFVPTAATHIYDITANTFSAGPAMLGPRLGHAQLTLNDGRVIVVSGLSAGAPQAVTTGVETLPSCGPGLQGVQITNFSFSPRNLTVPVGTTVRWTNFDVDPHTSTSSRLPPVWDSGSLSQNAFFQFTFNTIGSYDYVCSIHPAMTGNITVTGP